MPISQTVNSYDQTKIPRGVVEAVLDLWLEYKKEHDLPIRGKSMIPILNDGDIVIFRKGWHLIAHQVLFQYHDESDRRLYITQGDRSKRPDPPVEEGEIIGHVVGVKRGGRGLTVYFRQQKWYRKLVDINLHIKIHIRRWMWIFRLLREKVE
jgi:signal peptidase I